MSYVQIEVLIRSLVQTHTLLHSNILSCFQDKQHLDPVRGYMEHHRKPGYEMNSQPPIMTKFCLGVTKIRASINRA